MSPLEQEAWERGMSGKVGAGSWGLQEGWAVLSQSSGEDKGMPSGYPQVD